MVDINDTGLEAFSALQAGLSSNEPAWAGERRSRGMERFLDIGIPTTRHEAWKYTNLSALAKSEFRLARDRDGEISPLDLKPATIQKDAAAEIVFVNGHYSERLSVVRGLPAGATVSPIFAAENADLVRENIGTIADGRTHPFVALNDALSNDGAIVHLAKNTTLDRPVHLLFLTVGEDEPVITSPRILVVAEANTQLTLVESWKSIGTGRVFNNVVVEVVTHENARVEHYKLVQESEEVRHIASTWQRQGRDSSYVNRLIVVGAGTARNEIHSTLDGEGAETVLDGLYLLDQNQHLDNQTIIDHAKPRTTSIEHYKGILDDASRGIFEGRIIVRPDAQKTNAKQTNNNLILSREATAHSTPQLEIYADDVKCAHGSTIGRLDEAALFYLRARGISEEQARHILTAGFASEIVQRVGVAAIRERLESFLQTRLPVEEAS